VVLTTSQADDAAQNHVDRSGEERRAQEKEETLRDVRAESEVGCFLCGVGSPCVADELDLEAISIVSVVEAGTPIMG
jgi:hypothetical protein